MERSQLQGDGRTQLHHGTRRGQGFTRGENEPCAFLNELIDALVLLWTDDNFIDTEEDAIAWTDEKLDSRFDCTGLEILSPGIELDYVGMQIYVPNRQIYCTLPHKLHHEDTQDTWAR